MSHIPLVHYIHAQYSTAGFRRDRWGSGKSWLTGRNVSQLHTQRKAHKTYTRAAPFYGTVPQGTIRGHWAPQGPHTVTAMDDYYIDTIQLVIVVRGLHLKSWKLAGCSIWSARDDRTPAASAAVAAAWGDEGVGGGAPREASPLTAMSGEATSSNQRHAEQERTRGGGKRERNSASLHSEALRAGQRARQATCTSRLLERGFLLLPLPRWSYREGPQG